MNSKKLQINNKETRKTVYKEEFNKDIEILKKNQTEILEMKSSISQIKTQWKVSPVEWITLKTEYQDSKTR
jgi:hypothetical protein